MTRKRNRAAPAAEKPADPPPAIEPAPVDPPVVAGPRSSNLRVSKSFTEADKDRFLFGAFDYISKFFENSLGELHARNGEIETSFRKLDANRFTAVIYRGGSAVARCKIVLGGIFGRGISYSDSDNSDDSSFNDSMSVETDDQGIYLKPMGFGRMSGSEHHLTFEGAAEYFWARLVEPLQRSSR